MTPSLIDRRPRAELVAELYDCHAARLFAYCHDQLGDTTSAGNALAAVFAGVPAIEPPRAALYALARREIYRRDVAYALPRVDPAADPAAALVERVMREVRPHQREVLLLSAVCGLDTVELAWVLDVAADTAEQLMISARHRFGRSLAATVTSARTPALSPRLATEYDVLVVAPAEDALARLPWHTPPAALRTRILAAIPDEEADAAADPAATAQQKRWPTTPRWPLPLAEPNPVTNTVVVPADELTPPPAGRRSGHEATTEPMPRLRGASHRAPSGSRQVPPTTASSRQAPPRPAQDGLPRTPQDTSPQARAEGPARSQNDLTHARAEGREETREEGRERSHQEGRAGQRSQEPRQGGPAAGAEKGSPFSRALATGQWPTLQRTFRSAPATSDPTAPPPAIHVESTDRVTPPASASIGPAAPSVPVSADRGTSPVAAPVHLPEPASAAPPARHAGPASNALPAQTASHHPTHAAGNHRRAPLVTERTSAPGETPAPADPTAVPDGQVTAPAMTSMPATPPADGGGLATRLRAVIRALLRRTTAPTATAAPTSAPAAPVQGDPPATAAPVTAPATPAEGTSPATFTSATVSASPASPPPNWGSTAGTSDNEAGDGPATVEIPVISATTPAPETTSPAPGTASALMSEPTATFAASATSDTGTPPGTASTPEPGGTRTSEPGSARTAETTAPAEAAALTEATGRVEATGSVEALLSVAVDGTTPGETSAPNATATAERSETAATPDKESDAAKPARRPRRHDRIKPIKIGEHHFDWLWELGGLLLCIAIAMLVFFTIPTIVTP
ncbi:hypothetical protein Sme01_26590 [Sphaerisporangium melleum]|uniref:RNA polymerase sigma factor 70 region 4 type 2 domain-containing protein n=1 Tax=Sphaerisporangium melleum TaxID=321316 RepID=A0A917VFP0_9ACTN|nr:hypothetical protein [Sphaerisporangium melleum]GGK71357.1 hypothetical protein GCM10007964_12750 [Sphaerisporangium melleum]GII70183.1 hypothetical protein Sme01_26590 [Sphaerisporangium melleum]